MDHRAALILAASLLCGSAHATYATLSAPVGWTPGAGAAATYSSPVSPAQIAVAELGRINANAALTVNGTKVTVPAKLPIVKSAAKKIAAAAIYLHPGLRTAAVVAGWIGAAGLVYDVGSGLWKKGDGVVSDGLMYTVSGVKNQYFSTVREACEAQVGYYASANASSEVRRNYALSVVFPQACQITHEERPNKTSDDWQKYFERVEVDSINCPRGWFVTSAGCMQTQPMRTVDKDKFVEILQPDPRVDVDDLPNVVWPASWPVELPQVQPMFVPTGNPVPNPSYDPAKAPSPTNQPFNQPGVKVAPAPTTDRPWQVDLQPVNRPVDSPNPNPDPKVDPPAEPGTDGNGDKPRDPDKETQDLCEKHPEILACQKLDEPEDPGKLKVQEVDFNFQPESGFAGSASCPAPINVSVNGATYSISWQPFCNSLDMIKPFLIAMAWLSAAFIMLGARKE